MIDVYDHEDKFSGMNNNYVQWYNEQEMERCNEGEWDYKCVATDTKYS